MFPLDPYRILMLLPALLITLSVHEYAHARMAYRFGDPTAKLQGRLTLNPLPHLDPIGALMILLVGFGWAKPVPVNPYRFRDYKKGMLWVSLAGPLSNFVMAFIAMFVIYLAKLARIRMGLANDFLYTFVLLNIMLGVFNLLPIQPLDGSKIILSLARGKVLEAYRRLEPYSLLILLVLMVVPLGRWGSLLRIIIVPVAEWIWVIMNYCLSAIFGFSI